MLINLTASSFDLYNFNVYCTVKFDKQCDSKIPSHDFQSCDKFSKGSDYTILGSW